MNSREDLLAKFPGDQLSKHLLLQDFDQISERLQRKLRENNERRHGVEQQRLYSRRDISMSMIRFDRGGTITDQVVENGTVVIQVLDGKICFQAEGEHRHPDSGKNIVVQPGVRHSLQAEKPSTILLTILRG